MWKNWRPHTLLAGMWNRAAAAGSGQTALQMIKHSVARWPSNCTARYRLSTGFPYSIGNQLKYLARTERAKREIGPIIPGQHPGTRSTATSSPAPSGQPAWLLAHRERGWPQGAAETDSGPTHSERWRRSSSSLDWLCPLTLESNSCMRPGFHILFIASK